MNWKVKEILKDISDEDLLEEIDNRTKAKQCGYRYADAAGNSAVCVKPKVPGNVARIKLIEFTKEK